MKQIIVVILTATILTACAPTVQATQTASAQTQIADTQAVEIRNSTEAAASITAAAPTATLTPVPPSPTPTEPPGPTPSGKFGFFNVAIDQAGKDTVRVSLDYQLEKGLDLNGLLIMAQASTKGLVCSSNQFNMFSKPYAVNKAVSGTVKGSDEPSISITSAGKCSFKGFNLMVFRVKGSSPVTLYKQDFEIPFVLEK